MKSNKASIFLLALVLNLIPSLSPAETSPDNRVSLQLNAEEKNALLSEMRQMLASIQGVISGIGSEDRSLIAESALLSGRKMGRATPKSMKKKLPVAFKKMGRPTHMMFEELAVRAETDDMNTLTSFTGTLMQQCLACHAAFKAD